MPQVPQGGLSENTPEQPRQLTAEEIAGTIRAARDSVWVIENEMAREFYRSESKQLLSANVSHLELVVGNPQISGSGEDISDITAAIALGKQGLADLEATQ